MILSADCSAASAMTLAWIRSTWALTSGLCWCLSTDVWEIPRAAPMARVGTPLAVAAAIARS